MVTAMYVIDYYFEKLEYYVFNFDHYVMERTKICVLLQCTSNEFFRLRG